MALESETETGLKSQFLHLRLCSLCAHSDTRLSKRSICPNPGPRAANSWCPSFIQTQSGLEPGVGSVAQWLGPRSPWSFSL